MGFHAESLAPAGRARTVSTMNRRTAVAVLTACLLCAFGAALVAGLLTAASPTPAGAPREDRSPSSATSSTPTRTTPDPAESEVEASTGSAAMEPGSRCEDAWRDVRFADFARGFPLRLPPGEAAALLPACAGEPTRERQVALYREAFAMSALILEKAIRQESTATGLRPCEVIDDVTRPVTIDVVVDGQRQLAVEGYERDGILPIT